MSSFFLFLFAALQLLQPANNIPTCSNPLVDLNSYLSGYEGTMNRCVYSDFGVSCNTICGNIGGSCEQSDMNLIATQTNCGAAITAVLGLSGGFSGSSGTSPCSGGTFGYVIDSTPDCTGITFENVFCVCAGVTSGSGGQDPHFHGMNGENVDIIKDPIANDKFFSIYCDEKVAVNAKFSPNPEGLLFMTQFAGHVGEVMFSLNLGKYPVIYGNYFVEDVKGAENRTRFVFEDGTIESDGSGMILKSDNLIMIVNSATNIEGNVYFDIDMKPVGELRRQASGIIGRSFERTHSDEEFGTYRQFKLENEDDRFNSCPGDNGRFTK